MSGSTDARARVRIAATTRSRCRGTAHGCCPTADDARRQAGEKRWRANASQNLRDERAHHREIETSRDRRGTWRRRTEAPTRRQAHSRRPAAIERLRPGRRAVTNGSFRSGNIGEPAFGCRAASRNSSGCRLARDPNPRVDPAGERRRDRFRVRPELAESASRSPRYSMRRRHRVPFDEVRRRRLRPGALCRALREVHRNRRPAPGRSPAQKTDRPDRAVMCGTPHCPARPSTGADRPTATSVSGHLRQSPLDGAFDRSAAANGERRQDDTDQAGDALRHHFTGADDAIKDTR